MIVIWNMGIGGIQKRVRDVVLDVSANHPEVEVHILVKTRASNYFVRDIVGKASVRIYYFIQNQNKSNIIPSSIWIVGHYLTIKPDVCLTFLDHLSVTMVTLKVLFFWQRTKLILNEGIFTSQYLAIYRKHPFIWKWLIVIAYRMADDIIVPTRACQKDLVTNFYLPMSRIRVIHNWTMLKPFKQDKPQFDMIYVGRFEPEKNIHQLLEVIQSFGSEKMHYSLCLVGEGSLEKNISQFISLNGMRGVVSLVGYQKNVVFWLKKAKILVLPTMNEGLPNVVLEAAMGEVPSVVMRFPGCEEVIEHGATGLIVESKEAMARSIKSLLNNTAMRTRLGKAAQRKIQSEFYISNQKRFIDVLLS